MEAEFRTMVRHEKAAAVWVEERLLAELLRVRLASAGNGRGRENVPLVTSVGTNQPTIDISL